MGVGEDREMQKITEDPGPVQQMIFNRDECKAPTFRSGTLLDLIFTVLNVVPDT